MVPDEMPYSFREVSRCKDISQRRAVTDYLKLCEFPATTNPRKFCGNPCLYKYQLTNLLNCRRDSKNYKTLKEWFDDPELKEKLWKDTIRRNRRDKCEFPSPCDVYECHRINNGAIVPFKSSTAKYLYKKYGATSVLDPTMGWGGRMLGATSLGIKYTGFDTNVNMKEGYEDMIDDLDLENVKLIWKSSLTSPKILRVKYDFVLTSPPYVNMEIYEHCELWKSEDEFYFDFLIPLMNTTFKYLQVGGHQCYNISPRMYKQLLKRGYPPCDMKEDLRQQLGKQYKTKSQDYVYIWKKS
jgi:hypothetical protein